MGEYFTGVSRVRVRGTRPANRPREGRTTSLLRLLVTVPVKYLPMELRELHGSAGTHGGVSLPRTTFLTYRLQGYQHTLSQHSRGPSNKIIIKSLQHEGTFLIKICTYSLFFLKSVL
jgi:hypothetical protein